MKKSLIACAIAACAIAVPAQAQQQPAHWYAGISAGQARTSHDLVSNRETTLVDMESVQSDLDLKDTGWKALVGWRYNEMVALELYYADLGSHRVLSNIVGGSPPAPSSFDLKHKISGYGADLVFSAPFLSQFAVLGRVGAFQSHLEAEATLSGAIAFTNGDPSDTHRTNTRNETVLHYGAGAEWALRPNMALRLEWERFTKIGKAFEVGGSGTTGRADTDLTSLGFLMRF